MTIDQKKPVYTPEEETANIITHGIGAFLSFIGLVFMLVIAIRQQNLIKIIAASVYGVSLLFLYGSSTLYHYSNRKRTKDIFQLLDHTAIYLLIAGSYTPFTLIILPHPWGWSLFGIVWGIAIAGIVLKFFFINRFRYASTILYLAMGWIVIFAVKPLINNLPTGGLVWLFTGGLFYSLGVIFYLKRSIPFNHAIWHLFVLAGSISHFIAILRYVILPA